MIEAIIRAVEKEIGIEENTAVARLVSTKAQKTEYKEWAKLMPDKLLGSLYEAERYINACIHELEIYKKR